MHKVYPMDPEEMGADFTKSRTIKDKEYRLAQKKFEQASRVKMADFFLDYCSAVIAQQDNGALTIRESAYVISGCNNDAIHESSSLRMIVEEAKILRRHPTNYQASHKDGWKVLVKNIASERKKQLQRQQA